MSEQTTGHENPAEGEEALPEVVSVESIESTEAAKTEPPPPPVAEAQDADAVPEDNISASAKHSWARAIEDYEDEIKALGSNPAAATLLVEVGRIWEEHLGRPRNAALCYERALTLNSNDPMVLHAARRLATESGRFDEAIQHLQAEIGRTDDPVRKAALLAEKAAILEEHLNRPEDARAAYKEALSFSPAERFAVHSLERMRVPMRDAEGLLEVYARAADAISEPEHRVPLLLAAAQLAEDQLNDPERAVTEYKRLLDVDPDNTVALAALRRLLRSQEDPNALADVMKRSASTTKEAKVAARHLLMQARVERDMLKDPSRALASLLEALNHVPDDLFILSEVEALAEETGNYEEVARMLDRQAKLLSSAQERVVVQHRYGSVLEEKLDRPEEAIPILENAVKAVPEYVPAVQALGRLYEKTERYEDLASLFLQELARETDDAHGVSIMFKLAEIYDARLSRDDDAIETLTKLLEISPKYGPAVDALERIYRRTEKWDALVKLHESQIELTEDPERRVFRLQQIGQLAETELDDGERAAAAYRRIVELMPGHLDAIRTLARLAEEREDWPGVISAYELEVSATKDKHDAVGILHRIGLVHEERLGDTEAAMAAYEKVLARSPTYLPALRSLGRLYKKQGRWADLVSMYRKELEVSASETHSMSLLFSMAEVMAERIRDDDAAAEIYEEILARQADSAAALDALAEIHLRQSDHEKLVKVLLRAAPAMTSTSKRTKTLLWVAEIYERHLEEPERAAEIYTQLLDVPEEAEVAIDGLERIYAAADRYGELAKVLQDATKVLKEPRAKATALCRAAHVLQENMGAPDRAIECLEKALEVAPTDPAALLQLEQVLIARERWERVIEISERLADLDADPATFAARHLRIATIKESEFDPPRSAEANYACVLERIPGHPAAMRGLELEYRRSQAWERLMDLYHSEAMLTKSAAKKAGLLYRAGEIAELRMGNDPVAEARYKEALETEAAHLPSLRGRRRIVERGNRKEELLELIMRERDIVANEAKKTQLIFEAGVINEDDFEELDRAEELFRLVLQRVPGHRYAFTRLRARYEREGDWSAFIELLELQAKASHDTREQSKLLLDGAVAAEMHLQDMDRARMLYEQVLERTPNEEEALVRLGPILVSMDAWEQAKGTFSRLVDVSRNADVLSDAFRALGIIYQEQQEDLKRSVEAFEKAIASNPNDAESLERAAQIYQQTEDWTSSIRTLSKLSDVVAEAPKRVETLLDLGTIYESRLADMDAAIEAHERALTADPTHRQALARLADLFEKVERWDGMASALERVTRTFGAEEQVEAVPHRIRLARVYEEHLGDVERASAELHNALEADPTCADALIALARINSNDPHVFAKALEAHDRLIHLTPFRVDSYREMRRMYEGLEQNDRMYVMCEILMFLRSQDADEEMFFLEHRDQVPPHAASRLGERDHFDFVLHPQERTPARALFEILGREAHAIAPHGIDALDLKRGDRHNARSSLPLRKFVDELSDVFGEVTFDLWLAPGLGREVRVEVANPAALVVGDEVPRRVQEKEQRFLFGRAIEQILGGHHLLTLPDDDLDLLVSAAARIAEPRLRFKHRAERLDEMERQLIKGLSRGGRKALEQLSIPGQAFEFDPIEYRNAAVHTANRAGLVCANDVEVALRTVAREAGAKRTVFRDAAAAEEHLGEFAAVRELLAFAGSKAYATVRERLGFTIE